MNFIALIFIFLGTPYGDVELHEYLRWYQANIISLFLKYLISIGSGKVIKPALNFFSSALC